MSYNVKYIKSILEQNGIKRGERSIQEKIRELEDIGKIKVHKKGRAKYVDEEGLEYILSQYMPGGDVEAKIKQRKEDEYIETLNRAKAGDWNATIDMLQIEEQVRYEQLVEKEFEKRYLQLMLEALLEYNQIKFDKIKLKADISHLVATEDNYRYGLASDERHVTEKNGKVKIKRIPEITESLQRLSRSNNVYDYTNVGDLI